MSVINMANLRDLVGGWSCLAFVAGLAGAVASRVRVRVRRSANLPDDKSRFHATLALAMLVFALFVFLFVLPMSMAYSGPLSGVILLHRQYDREFAALIAFSFSLVFAFEAFRLRKL